MILYTLKVFKEDRRCKNGERVVFVRDYTRASGNSMMEEAREYRRLYPEEKGYRVDW